MAEERIINGYRVRRNDDGSLITLGPVNAAPQMPVNPEFPYKGPQAGATLGKTQADTTKTIVDTQGSRLDNEKKAAEIAAANRSLTQNPISEKDQSYLNVMRMNAGDLSGLLRDIGSAQEAVDRFKPSPGKGVLYEAGIPSDDDSLVSTFLQNNVVAPFLDPQAIQDYQKLRSTQASATLAQSQAQKGPQTEADAIRMKLAGVSPNVDVLPNAQILAEQQYNADMGQRKPGFYTYWANQLGSLSALNRDKKSVDQVWNEQYGRGLKQLKRSPGYRGMFGKGRAAPAKQPDVVDFNDWGN